MVMFLSMKASPLLGKEVTMNELLTAEELARLLKVSPKTVYRLAWSGGLPVIRISPKCVRFRSAAVEAWLLDRAGEGG